MRPDPVRVVLVDDEPLVRRGLAASLARHDGVVVVGEAGDGFAAVDTIERLRPDLVFLDVQMPALDGFEVLTQIADDARPAVVFVTAYEQYAVRAFDAHAIDYLLKPFDEARFASALQRALTWLDREPPRRDDAVPALLDTVAASRRRSRFVCRHGGRIRVVPVDEVFWIEARGNYVHLHHRDGPLLLRETLTSLASSLDAAQFVRVHRSAIVAWSEVVETVRTPTGDHEIRLRCGAHVPLGRSHRDEFVRRWVALRR